MAVATQTTATRTAIQREWGTMRILLGRLGNALLNRIFGLDMASSHSRRAMLNTLFLLVGIILTFATYPLAIWTDAFQKLFTAFLSNPSLLTEATTEFTSLFIKALTDPRLLSYLPVFVLPFILSQNWAAGYLADVFEIEDVEIARKFIREVSLHGSDNELHISTSKIKEDEIVKSPITRIGGPGYVSVELDTAILVEKPDGRPRVIGPTHDGRAVLDGFERIRDMIDLRDQIPDALEVSARSKDGIPISIADVRVIFSVFRNKKSPTPDEPHPFDPASIISMVYSKTHRVTDGVRIHEKWYRSSGEPIWVTPMKSLISRDLSAFMATRKLGEYLASIGAPEVQAVQKIEAAIVNEKQKIGGNGTLGQPPTPPVPDFAPRSQLSSLFNEFSKKFNDEQQKRGVQSQWVGVGTWKMPPGVPSQVIPDKHLEAWRLTLENLGRGSPQALDNLEKESSLLELQNIIQKVPIQVHHESLNTNAKTSQALRALMQAYSQQFNDAFDKYRKAKLKIPPSIVVAHYYLIRQFYHPPEPQVPAPQTKEEARLYAAALARTGDKVALEKLIEMESEQNPQGQRTDHLKQIIKAWDADMQ